MRGNSCIVLALAALVMAGFGCSSKDREFDDGAGTGGSGGSGGSSGAGASGGGGSSGSAGAGGCTNGMLDCDNSNTCATDGKTDEDNCGACGNTCRYSCEESACTDPIQVSVGFSHACAVSKDGSVRCWGSNFHGELGPNGGTGSTAPVHVDLPTGATAISAGGRHSPVSGDDPLNFSCALLEDKTVMCWGAGNWGQLGNGKVGDSAIPVAVKAATGVIGISAGGGHACAVEGKGDLYCWGFNEDGQVGDGTQVDSPTPALVTTSIKQVSAGDEHSCALRSNGDVYCWGSNQEAKLGFSSTNPLIPMRLNSLSGVDHVAAGGRHSCVLVDMTTYCWGSDYQGEVIQSFGVVDKPTKVDNVSNATYLSLGNSASGAITTSDAVIWGYTAFGVSMPATSYGPEIVGLGSVSDLSLGKAYGSDSTNCAIKSNGELVCWGSDVYGQVGNGDPVSDEELPAAVAW